MSTKQFQLDFSYKFLTNLVRIPISFLLQSIIPRLLGPVLYGNFDFLNEFSNRIIGFIDSGTSTFFYSELSRDKKNNFLIKFYAYVSIVITLCMLLFGLFSCITNLHIFLWPEQKIIPILLSVLLGTLTFNYNNIGKMIDACEITVKGERLKIVQLVFSTLFILVIFLVFKKITLEFYFGALLIINIIFIISSIKVLNKEHFLVFPKVKLSSLKIKYFNRKLWDTSGPLLIIGLFSLFSSMSERWILQKFGGSIQQGFFAISFKVSAFVSIFTGALMPLLLREFSKAFFVKDLFLIKKLFVQKIKILYVLTSFLAIYVFFNAESLINIIGGSAYNEAIIVLSFLAFYPIHQSIGQINGTFYFSSRRTKEYKNIGLFVSPFALIFCFILVAPSKYYGLHLGAIGLAIEMVIVQFFSVNILLYFNCKYLKISYFKILLFQVITLLVFYLIGVLIKLVLNTLFTNIYFSAAFYFINFTLISGILIILFPKIIDIDNRYYFLNKFKNIVHQK